jgi:hypothetical protein
VNNIFQVSEDFDRKRWSVFSREFEENLNKSVLYFDSINTKSFQKGFYNN